MNKETLKKSKVMILFTSRFSLISILELGDISIYQANTVTYQYIVTEPGYC